MIEKEPRIFDWLCDRCNFINPAAATRCGHCNQAMEADAPAGEATPDLEYAPTFDQRPESAGRGANYRPRLERKS
jgi:hypothetical protein